MLSGHSSSSLFFFYIVIHVWRNCLCGPEQPAQNSVARMDIPALATQVIDHPVVVVQQPGSVFFAAVGVFVARAPRR